MGIAGQIRENGLWPGKRFLGIDDPVDFALWGEECSEIGGIGKIRTIAEEMQLPSIVQPDQPFQNEDAGTIWTEHARTGMKFLRQAIHFAPSAESPPRDDHMHMRVVRHR